MNKLDTTAVDHLQHLAECIRAGKVTIEQFSIGFISDDGGIHLELEVSPVPEKK